MRIYAHFLGYSSAEGGVQELITQDTFSIGSLDIETGERDFDDFEFSVPWSSIFETKPQNNSAWTLGTNIFASDNVYLTTTVILLTGLSTPATNSYIWIENERVKITGSPSTGLYNIARGQNGSIPVKHFSVSDNFAMFAPLTVTSKRVSAVGLIVKIYTDEGKVLGYGQISELSITNSSFVKVKCKNLYSQVENSVTMENHNTLYPYADIPLSVLTFFKVNEFFALFDVPELFIEFNSMQKPVTQDNAYVCIEKVKDFLTQTLNINNAFLYFDNDSGKYKIGTLNRTIVEAQVTKRLISKDITRQNGVIEFENVQPVSSVKVSSKNYETLKWNNDSNLTNYYTQAKKIDISLDALDLGDLNQELIILIENIALSKIFFFNNIQEIMHISCDRFNNVYRIGSYYKFLDIFKFQSFYPNINENVFLCFAIDTNKASFIRTPLYTAKLVAPSLLVKKVGDNTYQPYNIERGIGGFVYCKGNTINTMKNAYTDSLIWEIDDKVTLIDTDRNITATTISDLDSDYFYLATNTGSVGDVFYLTIEQWNNGTIAAKNEVYLYDNAIGVL